MLIHSVKATPVSPLPCPPRGPQTRFGRRSRREQPSAHVKFQQRHTIPGNCLKVIYAATREVPTFLIWVALHPPTAVSPHEALSVPTSRGSGWEGDEQGLCRTSLGKQDLGTRPGNGQLKTIILISVGRTVKTIMFLRERPTKWKCKTPEGVTNERQSPLLHKVGFFHSSLYSLPSK